MNEEILLVTTHNCPKCHEAMKKLGDAGVDFKLAAAEENIEIVDQYDITEAPTLVIRPENKIYRGLGGVCSYLKGLKEC